MKCRDCGNQLEVNARGCPRCARNVEAERLIDRLIWHRLVPLLVVVLLVAAGAIYLFAPLEPASSHSHALDLDFALLHLILTGL